MPAVRARDTGGVRRPFVAGRRKPGAMALPDSRQRSPIVRSATEEALEVEAIYQPGSAAAARAPAPRAGRALRGARGHDHRDGRRRAAHLRARATASPSRAARPTRWATAATDEARVVWRTSPALDTLGWFEALAEAQRTGDFAGLGDAVTAHAREIQFVDVGRDGADARLGDRVEHEDRLVGAGLGQRGQVLAQRGVGDGRDVGGPLARAAVDGRRARRRCARPARVDLRVQRREAVDGVAVLVPPAVPRCRRGGG